MLYRPFKPQDLPAIYAIEEVCFLPPHRFSDTYLRQLIGDPHAATWIAERDAQILGFAIVEWPGGPENFFAYIQTLEVLPEARAQGVGGELLRRLEGSAAEVQASAIWLHVDADNLRAIRLYRKAGYRLRGREEDYYGRNRPGLVYFKLL